MENRIQQTRFEVRRADDEPAPKPISEILIELLARYQARFPEVHITIVRTPAI